MAHYKAKLGFIWDELRLYGGEKEMLNYKVQCIESKSRYFTTGKIYDIINGKICDEENDSYTYNPYELMSKFEIYEEENKLLLNCKVRCINDFGGGHTKDKIYEIKDGRLSSDRTHTFPLYNTNLFKNIEQINNNMTSKFELYETLKERFINTKQEKILIFETKNKYRFIFCGDRLLSNENSFSPINNYDDDLKHKTDSNSDIIKIYKTDGYIWNDLFKCYNLTPIWERPLETIELTIEEIAEKYGLKLEQIKIIK